MSTPDKRFAFSKRALEALPTPASGRAEYYDTTCPGLILRITDKGKATTLPSTSSGLRKCLASGS